jgi:gliding motility-associated-like protein
VNPTPVFEMEDLLLLCTDGEGLPVTGPDGFDSYLWVRRGTNTDEQISGDKYVVFTELGDYILEAGFIYEINGETTTCTNSVSFSVIPSNKAIIENIVIQDFSNNNTVQIEVSGDGLYEYSLDGSVYQESNLFENVDPGFATVFVRDIKGCGVTEKEISVLGFPKFFTPNGDGVNDYWQITGVSDLFQPDAFISIYDRYGAFVAQISPGSSGWNGTANSQILPASDYWFRINLKDGREFKGHFTLKR